MAGSPQWKVYDAQGNYQAACKEPEAAAALVALYGDGSKIKHGHSHTVWTEGAERHPAFESYDMTARVLLDRVAAKRTEYLERSRAQGRADAGVQA